MSILKDFQGNFLEEYIAHYPDPAFLRDIKTRRYLIANYAIARNLNLSSPKELTSLNFSELKERYKFAYLNQKEYEMMEKINLFVEKEQRCYSSIEVCTNAGRSILVQKMLKVPIISNKNEKTIAILTVNQDVTDKVDIILLFKLYREYFKKDLISKFLKSIGWLDYFYEYPTYTELLYLLAMYYDTRHKEVAKFLKKMPSSVHTTIKRVSEKIKPPLDLYSLLRMLRERQRDISIIKVRRCS